MARIYTDGGCRYNIGGWAWWCEDDDVSESGTEYPTTNQRMELYAALDAIDTYLDDYDLTIVSDSAYLINCFKDKWYEGWRRSGWYTGRGRPVANRDIWEPLINLVEENGNVRFEKVKGHNGDPGNEKVDAMCTSMIDLVIGSG